MEVPVLVAVLCILKKKKQNKTIKGLHRNNDPMESKGRLKYKQFEAEHSTFNF